MIVLEEGKPEKAYGAEVRCTGYGNGGFGCTALLGVSTDDLRYYGGTPPPYDREAAVIVRCPRCGVITDLKKRQWPSNAQSLKPFSTTWRDTGKDPEPAL